MKILAFDTTTRFLSVAVLSGEDILSKYHSDLGMRHAKELIPAIDKVLKESHLKLKNLDAIALSIGPGSFTGLRIGASSAKALSIASGVPIVTVPTLDVIAFNYKDKDGYIAPILDAKKDKVYSGIYKSLNGEIEKITDYLLLGVDDLLDTIKGPTLFFGDAVPMYGKYMIKRNPLVKLSKDNNWYPRAEIVAKLGIKKINKNGYEDVNQVTPMYMHPKECNVKGFSH